MWNIIQGILSGKSREDIYDMLSQEEKDGLKKMAAAYGISRQQRRKKEREDAKRKVHR